MKKIPISLDAEQIQNFCKLHHIKSLALFGSVLTNHYTKHSDVDLLVQFAERHEPHLLQLVAMEEELKKITGYLVDLKTPNDLSPYFRKDVLSKAVKIYG